MNEDRPPTRLNVNVRLRPGSVKEIDRLAAKAGLSRSDMIRVLLSEAVKARGGT